MSNNQHSLLDYQAAVIQQRHVQQQQLNAQQQFGARYARGSRASSGPSQQISPPMPNQPLFPPDEDEKMEMLGHLTEEDKAKRAELEQAPMQAKLRYLEKRWTKRGRGYMTEAKEEEAAEKEAADSTSDWYDKFALCVVRQYDTQNIDVNKTWLQVNSPSLKAILARVIGDYPGLSFSTKTVAIDFPPRCLYHYRAELKAALEEQEPGSEGASHLPILLAFIEQEFSDVIKESDNLREKGLVSYSCLWTLFRPGSIIFAPRMGHPRAYRLLSYQYITGQVELMRLNMQFIDYDGMQFGTRNISVAVSDFTGVVPIATLNALPLESHADKEDISERLLARGRRWESLAGQHFCEYKGVALDAGYSRYNIEGRVMVDTHTYHRHEANLAFATVPLPAKASEKGKSLAAGVKVMWDDTPIIAPPGSNKKIRRDDPSQEPLEPLEPLADEQCLLASHMVRGFSFTEKKFLDFFVDQLSDVEWNIECFDQLVLPDEQKELVQALVAEHAQQSTSGTGGAGFDDIVKGKGRGLILVLHGPPGVGKTLTAECVAEFSRRPLYTVSSGDLGTTAGDLDKTLARTLDLASTWKAVLLIDEADVFLERRSLHDMQRNSLVSIFLRTLEYYAGILFMTTNRVRTFDDAFKSRIHVPLRYNELPPASRKRVWRNFLDKVDGGADIDDDAVERLAQGQLNGRQIKNVVRTAKSLATHKNRRLDFEQLRQVMDIQVAFEDELTRAGEQDIDNVES